MSALAHIDCQSNIHHVMLSMNLSKYSFAHHLNITSIRLHKIKPFYLLHTFDKRQQYRMYANVAHKNYSSKFIPNSAYYFYKY